ncbi:hypothetical protein OH76DRAFT_1560243 [Lentinus brumalis]|uniref:Uncharacterized protein n=1 Tax=Lentinus brumalis TaxID=2498619 RepID=A0A371CTJ4_9APHY|nr:hypothetical protein OH76DRAFT_1560243 [Polyporus brumalis]
MSDAPAPPRSADAVPSGRSYGPLGRPYEYKHVEAPPRPGPKTAYGFVLGPKCRMRWARWYHEMANGDELSTLPPDEVEHILDSAEMASRDMLPGLIYSEFPNLPRLRNRLLPVKGEIVPEFFVFVLRDDATWQGMNAPLRPEDVEAVRRRLGVGKQEPNWYRIDGNAW